ncbi:MAG: ABC transporter substrate-binding protein [Thermomicrobiales bacterium]
MQNPPTTATAFLNRGIAAFHAGDREEALRLIAQALLTDPESELGWLWFAAVTEDPPEKLYALERAVNINPDSIANAARKRFPDVTPVMPNELTDIGALPLPPELADLEAQPRRVPLLVRKRESARVSAARARRQALTARLSRWWLPLLILLLLLGAFGFWRYQAAQPQPEQIYVAFAGPLTGPGSQVGLEMANSAQLAIDRVNASGGIDGRPLALLRFDDEGNADVARERASDIAADDRILLVIGHRSSATSLAAGEVYRDAGIPAITGSATADALTHDNPWYFRTIFTNDFEGRLLATYASDVLGFEQATIITTKNAYESSLATSFATTFKDQGTIEKTWEIDPDQREASIAAIVQGLQDDQDPGIVVLSLLQDDARALLLALRRAGLSPPLIGGDALGDESFADLFAEEPEEEDQRGYFTNGLYAASPMIYDATDGDALDFAFRYRDLYGTMPSWQAAKTFDATTIGIAGIAASFDSGVTDITANRAAVRDALAAINDPEVAVRGLTGPLFFAADNSVPQTFSIGRFRQNLLTSAPWQYQLVSDPTMYDVAAEIDSGRAIEVAGLLLRRYPIVDVGIDLNETRDLDLGAETFLADFFLWFRAPSADTALTDVFFPNATKPRMKLGDPLEERTEPDGTTYRMYRIQRTFTQPLDFYDYPWDTHVLQISLQNVSLPRDEVVYVPSPSILLQSQDERLRSGSDLSAPFNRIQNWNATSVYFISSSTAGRSVRGGDTSGPHAFVQFSTLITEISIARDVRGFLWKNMFPLALLALVTYLALFFSPDQTGARIGFAVTSILTAAVLLQSVTGQLDVGYTVAIEWGFFVYIALSTALVFINIVVEYLYKEKRYRAVKRIDTLARIAYPVICLGTIAFYITRYGF